jgi:hypothetical protein
MRFHVIHLLGERPLQSTDRLREIAPKVKLDRDFHHASLV